MRIEICGGIASGKTSLVESLTKLGFFPAHEQLGGISFLDEFYSDPDRYKFETEISFLLQHSVEIKKALVHSQRIVCDYSFEQDYAYALNNLNENELLVFRKVFEEIKNQIKEPELIIQLQCSTEVKLERIRNRGRVNEQAITKEYLDSTDALISQRLASICTPVECVNTEKYDFRDVEITKRMLLPLINRYIDETF